MLLILSMRPRLVVYNITLEQLRPLLADVVARLDSEARWAGESLVMPQLGVQLHLEAVAAAEKRAARLVGTAAEPARLAAAGNRAGCFACARRGTPAILFGVSLLSFGVLLAAAITLDLARDPGGVMQALNEMLRR